MPDVEISYGGRNIVELDESGTKTLETDKKYCAGNITVKYTKPDSQGQAKPEQAKTVSPSESAQTVEPDSGYTLSSVMVNAIPSNYVGSGVTRKAAATYTPTTTDQIVAANQYLTGAQTVKGDTNLVAGNIKKDVSIFGVSGSFEGASTVLPEIFPPKCVYVARAKIRPSASGLLTLTLNSDYAFVSGAKKKSTLSLLYRNDGNQFGNPAQAAVSNDTPGTSTSVCAGTANSSSTPSMQTLFTSTLGEIAKFTTRGDTECICTIFYSDADSANAGNPQKIPFQALVSCDVSAGTVTITEM